jgi:uncharacterized protein YlxW (UPF0749 family)
VTDPHSPPRRSFTSLLDHLANESLDDDYAVVARRRAAAAQAPGPPADAADGTVTQRSGTAGNRPIVVAVLAVFGVLIGVSALLTSKQAPVVDQQRAELVRALQQQQEQLDQERASVRRLRSATARLRQQDRTVAGESSRVLARSAALQVLAASTPVVGAGVVVTVDDAPGTISPASQGAVRDSDLQALVNGLWSAGAEAVAINGYRLGPGTAIRLAGEAITVNYRSLRTPYIIEAIGNPDTLPAAFAETSGGQLMASLKNNLRVGFSVQTAGRLRLAANTREHVRYATTEAGGD